MIRLRLSPVQSRYWRRTWLAASISLAVAAALVLGALLVSDMLGGILGLRGDRQNILTFFLVTAVVLSAGTAAFVRGLFRVNSPDVMLSSMDAVQLEILAAAATAEAEARRNGNGLHVEERLRKVAGGKE